MDGEEVRKRVAPDPRRTNLQATPRFFWWGVSCSDRPGTTSEALVNDLDQFRQHEAGLERRWSELVPPGKRLRKHLEGRGGEPSSGSASACGSVVDELAAALERLGAAGLPLVVLVEDAHAADVSLIDLLARLLAANSSRVLVITTSWTGLLDEPHRPSHELLARVPVERIRRIRGAELSDLSLDERARLAQSVLPELDETGARLLAHRYANPWALLTACRLGVVRRSAARGTLSPTTIGQLPGDVSGLYRQTGTSGELS